MKDLSQIVTCHGTNNSIHSKGSKLLMWVRGVCIFTYKWGCKQVNWNTNSFLSASFEPYEKK